VSGSEEGGSVAFWKTENFFMLFRLQLGAGQGNTSP